MYEILKEIYRSLRKSIKEALEDQGRLVGRGEGQLQGLCRRYSAEWEFNALGPVPMGKPIGEITD